MALAITVYKESARPLLRLGVGGRQLFSVPGRCDAIGRGFSGLVVFVQDLPEPSHRHTDITTHAFELRGDEHYHGDEQHE